jgi:CRP-like cAMP-binding protein
MPFARNTEVYGEHDPADYVYRVIGGAVRAYKMLSDGRRQVGAFYLPGDVFGLEPDDRHACSAEAISDSRILIIKRRALIALAEQDKRAASELIALTRRELQRSQDHVLLLVKTAQERVASFLLEMARRSPHANGAIELPMSRQDIADYLGLTIETVSRTLTSLQNAAAIALPSSRRVVLRNRGVLNRLNS